jgi:Glycerophosphoryl diester phosphodiesterase family
LPQSAEPRPKVRTLLMMKPMALLIKKPVWTRSASSLRRVLTLFLLIFCVVAMVQGAVLPGYICNLPPETPTARQLRHARVAERRAGTILMAHRGACTIAPENTLEAYAAAMDFGADGCEVDLRRTLDGVFVLFHDDMLDHLTDGFGKVEQLTCAELLATNPATDLCGASHPRAPARHVISPRREGTGTGRRDCPNSG